MDCVTRFLGACGLVALCSQATAATVILGNNVHGLTGLTTGTIAADLFTATIAAGPLGALLNETNDQGLGIDNRLAAGATADSGSTRGITKINIIGGSGPLAGTAEFVTLSFDRPGVLQHLLFDGVKDETLEFFAITLPNGQVLSVFDSQAQEKLNDQNFDLADLQVANPILCPDEEDDLYDLNYRFEAGAVFKITYGEVDYGTLLPGYVPVVNDLPNGSRFQGFSVVPEPSALVLGATFLMGAFLRGGTFGSRNSRTAWLSG